MIVHIFNNQKKFSQGYFQMLFDNGVDLSDMLLIHHGKKDSFFSKIGLNTKFIRNFFDPIGNLKMISPLMMADKIVVHSLASPFLLFLIILSPTIGEKIHWVIWGKDLYFYKMIKKPRLHHKAYEWLRKKAIKKIKSVISIFREDYELAKKWYHCEADNVEVVTLYPYALDLSVYSKMQKEETSSYTVLLGNSGSQTNNHIEALKILARSKASIKNIICPLSYGGTKAYTKQVIRFGEKLFGNKFLPLTDFMEKSRYFEILKSVDIGIFNYDRQEGLGNIWSLILSGKTIYMKKPTSTTRFFAREGIKVLDIDELRNKMLFLLSEADLQNNINVLEPLINVEASMRKWIAILE